MKQYFFLIILFCLGGITAQAQNYQTGVGLRLYSDAEVTIKHFVSSQTALEGIIELKRRGVGLTLLLEKHATAFNVEQLQWYYGAGGHVGFWRDENDNRPIFSEENDMVAGVSGIIGLEYTIGAIPFNISIDYKPLVHLIGYDGLIHTGAVSIRYVF